MKEALIIVISAPSGSGKTTLCNKLVTVVPNLYHSVSVTTRSARCDEVEGRDYFFVTKEEFQRRKQNDEFIEWAKVFDEYYGTPRGFVEETIRKGRDVLLNIDVQGQVMVRESHPNAVSIFILPPSMDALEDRLKKRKTENQSEISKRLRLAKKEMETMANYDYVIVNRNINTSLKDLSAIITAERHKVSRLKNEINDLRPS